MLVAFAGTAPQRLRGPVQMGASQQSIPSTPLLEPAWPAMLPGGHGCLRPTSAGGPWDLIRSIFRIHNETGNIWSHLIGAGYFAWVGVDAALGFSRATSFEQQCVPAVLLPAMAGGAFSMQKVLHGRAMNIILPCVLILLAMALLIWCHATAKDPNDGSSTVFLGLIVIQMLPLLFLELRIASCPDPEAMLAMFGTKVLLLHGCFMTLRVCAWPLMEVGIGWSNLLGTIAVVGVLHSGFRFKWKVESVTEHMDVLCLVVLAGIGALLTEVFEYDTPYLLLEHTIFTASSYIEVVGFVPAVMVHQSAKKNDDAAPTDSPECAALTMDAASDEDDLSEDLPLLATSSTSSCSHILPVFFCCTFPVVRADCSEATTLWIFLLVVASAYCCVCSVVFHLCSCAHVGVRDCTYKMDLTGIVVLIAASCAKFALRIAVFGFVTAGHEVLHWHRQCPRAEFLQLMDREADV
eukprot:s3511_g12.t1